MDMSQQRNMHIRSLHLHNNNNHHPHHHPQLQQHSSLPGNYSTHQHPHLDLSHNSTPLSSGTFPYNAVMPSNEIVSCPLTSTHPAPSFSSTTSSSSAVFFKSSSVSGGGGGGLKSTSPVKLKFWTNIFKRKRSGSAGTQRNPKQSLDRTNSYLLWIGTPVAAR